ncbi:unnamed protein product [Amoebophrya sp. A120]|nr:unnamed protein product [Amoebophrya sp. A120]|eukprot:GSA120T00001258001.1
MARLYPTTTSGFFCLHAVWCIAGLAVVSTASSSGATAGPGASSSSGDPAQRAGGSGWHRINLKLKKNPNDPPSPTREDSDSGDEAPATFFGAEVASVEERDNFVHHLCKGPRLLYVSPEASLVRRFEVDDEKPRMKLQGDIKHEEDDSFLGVTKEQLDMVLGMHHFGVLGENNSEVNKDDEAPEVDNQHQVEEQKQVENLLYTTASIGTTPGRITIWKIPAVVAKSPWLQVFHKENLKNWNAGPCRMQLGRQGSPYLLQFDVDGDVEPASGSCSSSATARTTSVLEQAPRRSRSMLDRALLTKPFRIKNFKRNQDGKRLLDVDQDEEWKFQVSNLVLEEWIEPRQTRQTAQTSEGGCGCGQKDDGILKIGNVAAEESGNGAGLLFMLRIMNYALHKPAQQPHDIDSCEEMASGSCLAEMRMGRSRSPLRAGISDLHLDAVRDAHVFWAKMGFVPLISSPSAEQGQSESLHFVHSVLVPALAASSSRLEKPKDWGSQRMRMSETGWKKWAILEEFARELQKAKPTVTEVELIRKLKSMDAYKAMSERFEHYQEELGVDVPALLRGGPCSDK